MANLKDIRDRIVSVKNTRKITEAMRLVAAAKVRRAQEQVLRSRPFADRLARVLENIQSRMSFEMADAPLLKTSDLKTITLLAVTGDRGLCGGYNSNIIKRTEQRYAELNGQGYKVDLVLIGRKAITYFSNRSSQYTIRATFTGLEQVPTSDDAESITTEVLAEFLSQSTDRIEVIYTKFINLVSCNPVVQTLLPLDPQGIAEADDEIFRLTRRIVVSRLRKVLGLLMSSLRCLRTSFLNRVLSNCSMLCCLSICKIRCCVPFRNLRLPSWPVG